MLKYVVSFTPLHILSIFHISALFCPFRRLYPHPLALSQGCHLEGPFISLEKKGAHPEQYLRSFQSGGMLDLIETYGTLDNVAMVTLAPELPNSEKVVRELAQRGITVSLGR